MLERVNKKSFSLIFGMFRVQFNLKKKYYFWCRSLPRSFTVKEDQSDLQRNVESNKRAVHLDEYCKKSKKTLSQLILSVSKTIKTYQDILKEVEKDIADDPIAQRLMRVSIIYSGKIDTSDGHE